jgi:hypothetical protein
VDIAQVLAEFNIQVRRRTDPDGSGSRIEADEHVVRWTGGPSGGWSGITWSSLGEANADQVIAEQITSFHDMGENLARKQYAHEQPPGLARRLPMKPDRRGTKTSDRRRHRRPTVDLRGAARAGDRQSGVTADQVHELVFGTVLRLRQSLLASCVTRPG